MSVVRNRSRRSASKQQAHWFSQRRQRVNDL
ncbi:hypothetical protein [Enterobacter phage 04_vB_Eclo_IJM]|nr:hypothetical protein [Enterobacter phage 04_vB_Eclo_IJM]